MIEPSESWMAHQLFQYKGLESLLRYIAKNFHVTPLGEYDSSNSIILRHDVDFDIKAAHRLALLEKGCSVRSTFFVMTTSYTYNILAIQNRRLLKDISRMGFEIGLHFYPGTYEREDGKSLARRVDEEAAILRSIVEKDVRSVSIHNPSITNSYPLFPRYKNAYDSEIFSRESYLSDSRMMFRKDVRKFVEKAKRMTVQILLHPMYYTKNGADIGEIFYDFACDFMKEVDELYRVNSTYSSNVKPDLMSYVTRRRIRGSSCR